ncbi:MAG TPA: MAPEG family protein [Burkholderiaceae bacterium]|nr:MAPEG family protein [Burkholderiaceae bacterium]
MRIVLLYAALLALLFVGLSLRTLRMRRRLRIAIGDANHPTMARAMRVHANFAEYVPFGLLLIYFVEATGAGSLFVHALGASLFAGRIIHAVGVSQVNENYALRTTGMALTLAPLVAAAVRLLSVYLAGSA